MIKLKLELFAFLTSFAYMGIPGEAPKSISLRDTPP
jgi:hypothetical protein